MSEEICWMRASELTVAALLIYIYICITTIKHIKC